MGSGRGIDELSSDADAVTALTNATLQEVAHTQFSPDLSDVNGPALVLEARVAGDNEQVREMRQLGDDVIRDAVGEVFLLGVAAHIRER